jgi:hypothetical protein
VFRVIMFPFCWYCLILNTKPQNPSKHKLIYNLLKLMKNIINILMQESDL